MTRYWGYLKTMVFTAALGALGLVVVMIALMSSVAFVFIVIGGLLWILIRDPPEEKQEE